MDSGTLLAVLVGIIAVAMIIQSIAILILVLNLRKSIERVETLLTQFTYDLKPVLESAREFLVDGREKVNAISAKLNAISANVLEISGIIKGQVARLDELLTEASQRARLQLVRADELLSETITRVEETGEVVRRAVLAPVREITAILSGVRTTLDFLFRRDKRGVEQATQDEELFI